MTDTTIRSVSLELIELPPQARFRWRDGLPGSEPALTGAELRIESADGTIGRAYTHRGMIAKDIFERRLETMLIGRDALAREAIWAETWELDRIEELPIYLFGLVDIALWDLAARHAGVPAHALMGYARTDISAYASTVTYESIAEFLDVADQCLARGFQSIKLHAWGRARDDARLIEALREHVGDGVPLMYDGSAGFDLPDAVYVGRALQANGYEWYEEPMREFSIESYRLLASRVQVPLLVAETSDGAHLNTADFIAAGCATYVRASAQLRGGVTGALRIAHLAESFGLRAEVHGMGPVPRSLCMAIPNTTAYEALVWGNPIQTDPTVTADGRVIAPTSIGFGWDDERSGP